MSRFIFQVERSLFLFYTGIFFCFFLLVSNLNAEEKSSFFKLPDSIQVHGFLSQGFLHTSDNNLFGHSDDNISVDFRELGLNTSWRVLPELQLAMQVVWRNAGQTDNQDLRIDYGVVNYNFFSSESTTLGVKAGRIPTPLGFYNETRDVASTRPSVLLPQSIYFDRNRNISYSADGGYFYGEQRSEYGDFDFTIGVVNPRTDDPSFKNGIVGNDLGNMVGHTSWVTRLNYEWQSGLVRLGISYADLNADYHPGNSSKFSRGSIRFKPLVFSAQYNAENWSLTAEYAYRKTELAGFGLFPNMGVAGESFYIQGIYKFTNYLEGLVRYDELSADKNDKKGDEYALRSMTGAPNYSRYAKDWTVGLRVKLFTDFLISAEYHRVNGTAWLSGLENDKSTTKYWDLYTLLISYSF
ncbi:MAG: hypothetical protein L3J59_03130 [Methylococcaceae bacterium]|nr:hypothetical protein [Methylococcaceae bacterium]